jgi:hypothetical protein
MTLAQETRTIRWNDIPRSAELSYTQKGDTITVHVNVQGWGGVAFQEGCPTHETPEELVRYAKEYSLDMEAIASAELNAGNWNYQCPF